jgi:hypothetical protein
MNPRMMLVAAATIVFGPAGAPAAGPAIPLHVLYVGKAGSPRAAAFTTFLKEAFTRVSEAKREGFDPASARDADVVLLDWSQSEGQLAGTKVPLGSLEQWTKPTVLLNHAGLLVAAHWQLIGGAG